MTRTPTPLAPSTSSVSWRLPGAGASASPTLDSTICTRTTARTTAAARKPQVARVHNSLSSSVRISAIMMHSSRRR